MCRGTKHGLRREAAQSRPSVWSFTLSILIKDIIKTALHPALLCCSTFFAICSCFILLSRRIDWLPYSFSDFLKICLFMLIPLCSPFLSPFLVLLSFPCDSLNRFFLFSNCVINRSLPVTVKGNWKFVFCGRECWAGIRIRPVRTIYPIRTLHLCLIYVKVFKLSTSLPMSLLFPPPVPPIPPTLHYSD